MDCYVQVNPIVNNNFIFGGGNNQGANLFCTENEVPLPVDLVELYTSCENGLTTINWVTASEQNSWFFDILRSTDGTNFESADNVPAAGNTNHYTYYSWTDPNRVKGITYYRLMQYDFDGSVYIYPIFSSNCYQNINDVSIYPNPTNDASTVSISTNQHQAGRFVLSESTGKIIQQFDLQLKEGLNYQFLDARQMQDGVYYITIHFQHEVITRKWIVVK